MMSEVVDFPPRGRLLLAAQPVLCWCCGGGPAFCHKLGCDLPAVIFEDGHWCEAHAISEGILPTRPAKSVDLRGERGDDLF